MDYPRLKGPNSDGPASISIDCMMVQEAAPVAALFEQVVEDLPYYNRLAKDSEIAKHSMYELQRLVAIDKAAILIARIGQSLAGFCVSRDDDCTLWLAWFGVAANFRRAGIGQSMLDALETRAREGNFHKIWCDSRTTNFASASLLSRHGFRRLCTVEDHWYRQDFILWEKSVS